MGNNNLYIDKGNGDYYLQVGGESGSFVFQGNLKGPTGIPGPQGPAGDTPTAVYAERFDIISDALVYRAYAIPGSVDSDPVWRIIKYTITDELVDKFWANGNANFTNVWDDRLTYTYF